MVGVAFYVIIVLCNVVTIVTEPVTFTGDGYARYTLLDSGIAKQQQVAMEMAFYEESISMRVQTNADEGLLFQMSGDEDFAILEVYYICVVMVKHLFSMVT